MNFTKCWPTIPVAPKTPTSILGCMSVPCSQLLDHVLVDFNRFEDLFLGYVLAIRVGDVDSARPYQVGLAPGFAEGRNIGGEGDDGRLETWYRAEMNCGYTQDLL